MRRRQVWAERDKAVAAVWPLISHAMESFIDPPGDDALPEPKRKAGWPKGRKRK